MEIIKYYFPDLSEKQLKQFSKLKELYEFWNAKINVISRKDISKIYINHVLHSLSISRVILFKKETKILDLGTGGGFPGLPLAILFPETKFVLCDSIGKKIKVIDNIIHETGITNINTIHKRGEEINDTFDFIISRAVTNMRQFKLLVKNKFNKQHNNTLRNGILYLKGGNLSEELKGIPHIKYEISNFFKEEFFLTKKIIYIEY